MGEIKVLGYVRKSPDDKEDTETSINNQIELIKLNCDKLNYELVDVFIDRNISGGDRHRKGFLEMENTLLNSDINIVIVKDAKRFARDSSFQNDKLKDYYAFGKNVYSIADGRFLDLSFGDRVMSTVNEQNVIDGKKYADMSEELKMSKKLPCIPSPFGYMYNWSKDSKGNKNPINKSFGMDNWIIIKKDARIVLSIVLDYLDKRDYRSTIKDLKIHKTKYYRVVKNAKLGLYSGLITYIKKHKDSNGKVVRTEKIRYEGTYEHIISKELFQKLNPLTL